MQEEEWTEFLTERHALASARIREIGTEETVPSPFSDYFRRTAEFLNMMEELKQRVDAGGLRRDSLQECQQWNDRLYQDILPARYEKSYGNPDYAVAVLGEVYGRILSFLYTELRGIIAYVYEQRLEEHVVLLELFIEIYDCFEEKELPTYRSLQQIVYWFVSDYSDLFTAGRVRETIDPSLDFAVRIVMDSDLRDLRYLYWYGEYVSETDLQTAAFLNTLSEEEVQAMADTYTEGYRAGFLAGGKDLSVKKSVNIRYRLGFERMIRCAVKNFEEMGLQPVIYRAAVSTANKRQHQRIGYTGSVPNPQFDYDHRADNALYLDRKYMERKLSVMRAAYEKYAQLAKEQGGPAVVEVFGEKPFVPCAKASAYHLTERQQELSSELDNESAQLTNQYIAGKERSFTIIAFPVPEIGPQFAEIFRETVKVNTMDNQRCRKIQQKLIDALDQGEAVHILGREGNHTDLTVALAKLSDPQRQTLFENCVADVNIPAGEVFTSPKLAGTNGILHVKQVYLDSLNYINLEVKFRDGMVTDYSCQNFDTVEENRRYFYENVLFGHETLPMGEFAIGTNTAAYRMGKKYDIAGRLPILIAEKTGPHFALGDTCYSWEEDTPVYNPDGKEVIPRDNEVSLLRRTDCAKAYFGCHTDITIPYEEIGCIEVLCADGRHIALLENGRFVLPGTEELNLPLEQA